MATVKILWARHGQNVANLSGTFSYRVFDGDLTELGQGQAAEMAARLAASAADDPICLLACSPLRRARQTAEIVGPVLGLPIALELDDLRELNVGALDGRSDPDAWHTYHQVLAAWLTGDTHVRFPGGEDRDELCTRLHRALLTVARHSAGKQHSWWHTAPASARHCPAWRARQIRGRTCLPALSRPCSWIPVAPLRRSSS
jgi:broad specificity phosphatase PhoE